MASTNPTGGYGAIISYIHAIWFSVLGVRALMSEVRNAFVGKMCCVTDPDTDLTTSVIGVDDINALWYLFQRDWRMSVLLPWWGRIMSNPRHSSLVTDCPALPVVITAQTAAIR